MEQRQLTLSFDERGELYARLFSDVSKELLAAFKEFHAANPHIYELFKKYATEAKASGRSRFSHWMIINRIRWYTNVETAGDDFKISNDFIAIYARLLVWQMPEFEGFFLLKQCNPERKLRQTREGAAAV
jgi:hypothetical protein